MQSEKAHHRTDAHAKLLRRFRYGRAVLDRLDYASAQVLCHGGAWCLSGRTTERLRHQAMAAHGIVSIALDFCSGNEDPYPASVQDINYAVRWAKLNARAFKTRPDLVGLSGQSSGGHLAMLVAMRPHTIRAMPRSRCRPVRKRTMRPSAAS